MQQPPIAEADAAAHRLDADRAAQALGDLGRQLAATHAALGSLVAAITERQASAASAEPAPTETAPVDAPTGAVASPRAPAADGSRVAEPQDPARAGVPDTLLSHLRSVDELIAAR
jgi:hypothetical protein